MRRELLGGRGLPHHDVAQQGRRGGQVACDRGEVERRDRQDEALQRPVLHPVPGAGADCGCSASSRRAKWTLNRQKSISSAAASISAWYTDLDWLAIVAALTAARHGPLSRSAARSRIAARSSKASARQPCAAARAASIASATSSSVALRMVPSTCR